MSDTAVARADLELRMVEGLVDCAHWLARAFGAAAEAEATVRLELFDAFSRSFLAVRMGIRLSLQLRAAQRATPRPAVERVPRERERLDVERADFETRPERLEDERERDRDYEPVSLPRFLATLGVVAADAARLGRHLSPEVRQVAPALSALLASAKAPSPAPGAKAGVGLLARAAAIAPKVSLLSSTSAPRALAPLPRPPPRRSG